MKLLLLAGSVVLLLTFGDTMMMLSGTSAEICRIKGDFNSIGAVLKMYQINNGSYPTQKQGLMALIEKPADFPADKEWAQLADKVPLDPWGNPYQYIAPTSPDGEFRLFSFGRDGISLTQGNDSDDTNNWSSQDQSSSWTDRFSEKNIPMLLAYALLLFALLRWIRSRIIRSKA